MAQEIFRIYGTIAVREDGDIDKRVSDIGKSSDKSGDAISGLQDKFDDLGGAAGGLAGILGATIIAALKNSIEFADKFAGSIGDLEFDTNATAKEMVIFEDSLKNLYTKGYGESIGDVADAISNVHRQTGALNDELDNQVEKTMVVSEKLGTDYGETIKTVDSMVKIFGITHDEAFDVITRGYQENLNVGGDLLDLFNEYSTNLNEIGIDEQDMLNIMVAARDLGIESYDKLLDSIKEYKINILEILQDEEAAQEYFDKLGLKASEVKDAFINGGDEARNMSVKIMESLLEVEDPIERNRLGVDLMGSMWEDTSGRVGEALISIDNNVKDVQGTTDKLIATKTDTLSEEWKKFTRSFEINTYKPVGDMLKDQALQVLEYFNKANKATEDGFDKMVKSTENWDTDVRKMYKDWYNKSLPIFKSWKDEAAQEFNDAFNDILGLIDWFVDEFMDAQKSINNFTNSISNGFDDIAGSVGNVINKISNIHFPSVPDWIPGFADGVRNLRSSTMALVGEEGQELVYLPQGASVYSNTETQGILSNTQEYQESFSGQKATNYNIGSIVIDPKNIKSMTDFVDMINNFKDNMISYGGEF